MQIKKIINTITILPYKQVVKNCQWYEITMLNQSE